MPDSATVDEGIGPEADFDPEAELARIEAGLDALSTGAQRVRPSSRRIAGAVLPAVVACGLLLVGWQVVVAAHLQPSYVLPGAIEVGRSLAAQWDSGLLADAVWRSLSRALVGYTVSVLIGTLLGLLVARMRWVRAAVKPVLSALQSLPSVAWVPAAIMWFGLTDAAVYTVVLLGAVPSVAIGMVTGHDQIPPLYGRVGQILGARGLRAAQLIVLPAALPGYLGGLRQAWAFAWRSLMAAELITQSPDLGTGLGQLLDRHRELSEMDGVLAVIIVILAVGIVVELLLFAPLERRVLRRRGLTTR
ncbi:MAG TPA: ABC transporter permease [Pseudonocardiaceae bacterium]|jgi:NitT/TauT family transport system permease protein|nr:ABC transporter permease [Pseudonocardiaceae bacterium]